MHIPFDTMQERHLVYVYAGMWLLQGGYFGRVAWQWFHTRKPNTLDKASQPRR